MRNWKNHPHQFTHNEPRTIAYFIALLPSGSIIR